MDFFGHQDQARKRSSWLILGYGCAIIATMIAVYALIRFVHYAFLYEPSQQTQPPFHWWDPSTFIITSSAVGLLVGVATLVKWWGLRSGGEAVAISMGAEKVLPTMTGIQERRLVNVVEEMALASGIPMPAVYIMRRQKGINAFAAGYRPDQAVVCVSQGCLDVLTRQELQGVVAHEFSHILNGDMRINIRLISGIAGIMVLHVIGRMALESFRFSSHGSRTSRRGDHDSSATWVILVVGLGLILIGSIGTFFAHLLQAAVSRQREYLADASAVQFTRDTSGIAGALKKIGGWKPGSILRAAHTQEVSHMLFADGIRHGLTSPFATHPPLTKRIQRLEPDFEGPFLETRTLGAQPVQDGGASAFSASQATEPSETLVDQVGTVEKHHVAYAHELYKTIVGQLQDGIVDLFDARSLCFALVLHEAPQDQVLQEALIKEHCGEEALRRTRWFYQRLVSLGPEYRLPLLEISLPVLKGCTAQQKTLFFETLERLIEADKKVELFEYCIHRILWHGLEEPRPKGRFALQAPFAKNVHAVSILLSALAHVGNKDAKEAERAFLAGKGVLQEPLRSKIQFLDQAQCDLQAVDECLEVLQGNAYVFLKRLLEACEACICYDRTCSVEEKELFRAVAACLHCPCPPLLEEKDHQPASVV